MSAAVPPENQPGPDNLAAIARIILAVRRRREAERAAQRQGHGPIEPPAPRRRAS